MRVSKKISARYILSQKGIIYNDLKNEKNQLARFNALYNINDLNNHTVLDLGCGIGDFLELLNENKIVCNYTGIDHLKDFIEFAAEKYKLQTNTCFLLI